MDNVPSIIDVGKFLVINRLNPGGKRSKSSLLSPGNQKFQPSLCWLVKEGKNIPESNSTLIYIERKIDIAKTSYISED